MLITERLNLRAFTLEDLPRVHSCVSDPDVFKYLVFGPSTVEDTSQFLRMAIAEFSKVPLTNLHLAIVELSSGQIVGACGLTVVPANNHEAELGYWLCRNNWYAGYATEAARAVVHYGFAILKLHRIFALCRPANKASARVLEKVGMQKEGHLREHRFVRGKWEDSLQYSILDQEWEPQAPIVRIEW